MTKRAILLQALESTPADVARLVRPLNQESVTHNSDPGARSALEVLSHLIGVERAYHRRLNRILTEELPEIPLIQPEETTHIQESSPGDLSQQFGRERAQTLATLRGLNPGQWQRAGIHETKGRSTLRFLVQDLIEHDIEHTNQLVEIMQGWRARSKRAASDRTSQP